MSGLAWGAAEQQRLDAIRDDLATVSTATACNLLITLGWRNQYLHGLMPLRPLGLESRIVGRARTARYLTRRGPEGPSIIQLVPFGKYLSGSVSENRIRYICKTTASRRSGSDASHACRKRFRADRVSPRPCA